MWRRTKIASFATSGLSLSRERSRVTIPYGEILTAERLRNRRGLRLHMRRAEPVVVAVKRRELFYVEDRLRGWGVRIVDCWGAILAPTLFDFEEELGRDPVHVRQSSDNA